MPSRQSAKKSPQSLLGSNDIKQVTSRGNQPWRVIGLILMRIVDTLEKTLMLGKIEGSRRQVWESMRWVDVITDSMDMNLVKLWEVVRDKEVWHATVHRIPKSQTWLGHWTHIHTYTHTHTHTYTWKRQFKYLQYYFFCAHTMLLLYFEIIGLLSLLPIHRLQMKVFL